MQAGKAQSKVSRRRVARRALIALVLMGQMLLPALPATAGAALAPQSDSTAFATPDQGGQEGQCG